VFLSFTCANFITITVHFYGYLKFLPSLEESLDLIFHYLAILSFPVVLLGSNLCFSISKPAKLNLIGVGVKILGSCAESGVWGDLVFPNQTKLFEDLSSLREDLLKLLISWYEEKNILVNSVKRILFEPYNSWESHSV